jgi:hypothetical protein
VSMMDWKWTVRRAGRFSSQPSSPTSCLLFSLLPCSSLEMPSGTYLTSTLLRLYFIKPYKGDGSVYLATASRTSDTPPVPRASRSTSSLEAYLSRNLMDEQLAHEGTLLRIDDAYQPPGSATDVS